MTKQQQIELLGLTIRVALEYGDFSHLNSQDHDRFLKGRTYTATAEQLYNAGYRKDDEVRKETAREILQTLYNYPHEYHESKIKELAKQYGVEVKE